jgi:acetyl-CoA carboxylase carboxyl transferase subunit alpha
VRLMTDDSNRFEEPLLELKREIAQLSADRGNEKKVVTLKKKLDDLSDDIYGNLSAWQKTLTARHPSRPYTLDFIKLLFHDFHEIHGDRKFRDDPSIVAGFARFRKKPCVVIGHQKGRDTNEKIYRNFGMSRPEGYRKAIRIMRLAEKFGRPIFTFIDTPGAYPGIGAEERGQAEAIADNLKQMAEISVPIIVTVTGEGGSGGALALGVGDRILMLEHAVYSVISPEGCAAILWKDPAASKQAAEALKITAQNLFELGVIDTIVEEPGGGAHDDPEAAAEILRPHLEKALKELSRLKPAQLRNERYRKFRGMGAYARA